MLLSPRDDKFLSPEAKAAATPTLDPAKAEKSLTHAAYSKDADGIYANDVKTAQMKAYAEVQKQIVNDLPFIPVGQSSSLTEFSTAKVTGWPTEDNLYAIPAPWQHPGLGIVAANLKAK